MPEKGVAFTPAGVCCNPECGRVLYRELMASADAEACFECDPEQFREGAHPALAHLLEPLAAELFARSGGRVPVVGNPLCSEACCRRRPAA